MNKESHWKDRLGIVYSTNPDFEFASTPDVQQDTLPPSKQTLTIQLSTKHRKGKTVTLITGFVGKEEHLRILEKELKSKCAAGGSCKDNVIIIQGDFRKKIGDHLKSSGYKIRGI